MSALPAHQSEEDYDSQQDATTGQPHIVTPESDIAYMGGSAEEIDRLHPMALIGSIVVGIAMWGLIIAGLIAIF